MTKPIVLLHGWGYTPHVWDILRLLFGQDEVFAPALSSTTSNIDRWADDFLHNIPTDAVLIGWSLGALLAVNLASRHEHKFSRLVLIGATPRFVKNDAWPHGLDAVTVREFRDAFVLDPQRALQRFVALQVLGDSERHRVSQALHAGLADPTQESLQHGLQLLAESDLRQCIPTINMPCLIIHGAQDALMPLAAAQWLNEQWADSQLHVIPAAGHAPFVSHPETVASLIRNFVHAA